MQFSTFETSDLRYLPELQPPDWGNLIPRFEYFIRSKYSQPIKISDNEHITGVGTSMLHKDSAWLACIVVHPDHRSKGLGKMLTQRLIDEIDRVKYQTIYLDATDFGYPVYRKLGFEIETEYMHLKRLSSLDPFTVSEHIFPFREEFLPSILKLDQEISGECRKGILSDFLTSAQVYAIGGEIQGFYIPDWGDGPVIARNDEAGLALMKVRSQEKMNAVIPAGNKTALNFLESCGFETYKTSKRMLLGQPKNWKPTGSFNWISGQLG